LKTRGHNAVYKNIYLVAANTIMLFVVVNLALAVLFFAIDKVASVDQNSKTRRSAVREKGHLFDETGAPIDNGNRIPYQMDWFDYTAYEGVVSQAYAGTVLDDFASLSKRGLTYQPWVQFSEPPYRGKLVNIDVDSHGLQKRRTENPKDTKSSILRIFTFGGSTTFGYNVSDEHTWPSYLSSILNKRAHVLGVDVGIEVTNYGHAFYYASQEAILLTQLLKSAERPDLVIFMDGVNEYHACADAPQLTHKLKKAMHDLQFSSTRSLTQKIDWLPIARLAKTVNPGTPDQEPAKQEANDCEGIKTDRETGVDIAAQYRQNVEIERAISKVYGVTPLFFLQPDSSFNYPIELFRDSRLAKSTFASWGFKKIFYSETRNIEGVVDLTALFKLWGPNRKAIVDDFHYSPLFDEFLAQHVADRVHLDEFLSHRTRVGIPNQ